MNISLGLFNNVITFLQFYRKKIEIDEVKFEYAVHRSNGKMESYKFGIAKSLAWKS